MKVPERSLAVKIIDRNYTIEFPKTRGLIAISVQRALISNQLYESISSSQSSEDTYSKFLIDMIATFRVLIPDLEKDLNVSNMLDLDPLHSKKLLEVYLKEVYPWMIEWHKLLASDPEEKKTPEETDGNQ